MNNKDLQVAINNVRNTTLIRHPNKLIRQLIEFLASRQLIHAENSDQGIVLKKLRKLSLLTLYPLSNQFVKAKDAIAKKRRLVDEHYGEMIVSTSKGIKTASEANKLNVGGVVLGYINYSHRVQQ